MTDADAYFWLGFWHHLLGWGCFGGGLVVAALCLALSTIPTRRALQLGIRVIGLCVVAAGTIYSYSVVEDGFNRMWSESGRPLPDYSARERRKTPRSLRWHRPEEYRAGSSVAERTLAGIIVVSLMGLIVGAAVSGGRESSCRDGRRNLPQRDGNEWQRQPRRGRQHRPILS